MTTIPITALIASAIRLNDVEREMPRWQVTTDMAEKEVASASPATIIQIVREMAIIRIGIDSAFDLQIHDGPLLKERYASLAVQEIATLVAEQWKDNERQAKQLLDLRNRIRQLDGALGSRIGELRDQTTDQRLRRLLKRSGANVDRTRIEDVLKSDHNMAADAWTAWRTSHENRPMMVVVGRDTTQEIDAAIRTLESEGLLVRHRGFGRRRWTVVLDHADASRKAA